MQPSESSLSSLGFLKVFFDLLPPRSLGSVFLVTNASKSCSSFPKYLHMSWHLVLHSRELLIPSGRIIYQMFAHVVTCGAILV